MSKEIPSPELRKKMADIFLRAMHNFRYRQGASKFEKVLKKYPDEESWWCQVATLYDHIALEKNPKNKKEELKNKRFYENLAKKACLRALKINPESFYAYQGLGRIYWHNKDKKAIYYYRKAYDIAVKQTGDGQFFSMDLMNIYTTLKKYKIAEKYGIEYLKSNPPSFGILNNMADLYIKLKDKKKARLYLRRAKDILGKDPHWVPGTKGYEKALRVLSDFADRINRI